MVGELSWIFDILQVCRIRHHYMRCHYVIKYRFASYTNIFALYKYHQLQIQIQICLLICPTQQQLQQKHAPNKPFMSWKGATLSWDWPVETNDSELYPKWLGNTDEFLCHNNFKSLQTFAPDITFVAGCSCWTGDKLFRRVWFDAIREAFPGAQMLLRDGKFQKRNNAGEVELSLREKSQWSKDGFPCWWVLMVVVNVDFLIDKASTDMSISSWWQSMISQGKKENP